MKKSIVTLASGEACMGCMACGDACPQGCISFPVHSDGFWYPQINYAACIGCQICMRACPALTLEKEEIGFPAVYAAWASKGVRKNSASGGAFYALAKSWVLNGGYVAGAVFEGKDVRHIITNDLNALSLIQGTKYFQSDIHGIYKRVDQLLRTGEKVLFSGTSCQVAGLLKIVGDKQEKLVTIDLICYGVPSTLSVCVEEKMRGLKLCRILRNRDKDHDRGWRNSYWMTCDWENGKRTVSSSKESFMLGAFNSGKIMRYSCYHCLYKKIKRHSDITIGDYHNVKGYDEEKNDGISLVMVHTQKGRSLLQSINGLTLHERPLEECLKGKRTIYYNDSIYAHHPMRKMMPWMLRHAPSWLLNISYRSFVKSKNPLVWPFSAFDYVYREINQRKANKKLKEVMNQINKMK